MGKTDQSFSLKEITNIITTQMATMEVDSSSQYSSSNTTFQSINNSSNCKNRKIIFSDTQYVSYNTVFQSSVAVQSLYANIVNQITANLESTQDGASIGKIDQNIGATIRNIIQTTLTQSAITTYYNNISQSETSVQICNGSQGGRNFIFGSYSQLFDYYQQTYTQMVQVQQVSADISNIIDAAATAKQTGLVAMLTRMITVICVVLIIVAAIVVVVVLFGMLG
jgi:hypothetical protein